MKGELGTVDEETDHAESVRDSASSGRDGKRRVRNERRAEIGGKEEIVRHTRDLSAGVDKNVCRDTIEVDREGGQR